MKSKAVITYFSQKTIHTSIKANGFCHIVSTQYNKKKNPF